MASKVYSVFIKLNGDFRIDELKYSANLTISDAKKIYKKLIKISGLARGKYEND